MIDTDVVVLLSSDLSSRWSGPIDERFLVSGSVQGSGTFVDLRYAALRRRSCADEVYLGSSTLVN